MLKQEQPACPLPTDLRGEQLSPNLLSNCLPIVRNVKKTQIEQVVELLSLLGTNSKLFDRYFHRAFDLYCRVFPDPSEREPQEVLRSYLEDPTSEFNI